MQPPEIPTTSMGTLLKGFLDAVNSGDREQIEDFVTHHFATERVVTDAWPTRCCAENEVTRTMFNIARRSGGLVLDSIFPRHTGITAFALSKRDGRKIYLDLESASAAPDRIVSYQLVVTPPGTQEFLPKVAASMPAAARIELARRALEKAAARDLFSGTFAVARDGQLIFSQAFGEADKESHVPNTLETQFGIASVGKLFTGIAVAQLVSEGKLSYDEPIIRYLPDYPNRTVAGKITLRQLLTHSSGLGDIFAKQLPNHQLRHLKDYYPFFANDPLLFEPGKGQAYSNTGFLLASIVVEEVSGEEFSEYLRRHIFTPAGMMHTGWESQQSAHPYTRDNNDDPLATDLHWVRADPFYKHLDGPPNGAGGEYSTAEDLIKFAFALLSGKILDPSTFKTLVSGGLGCQCSDQPGNRIYAHPGGGPGIDAGLKLYLDQDFVVVFLSNYDPPFPQVLANDIGELLVQP